MMVSFLSQSSQAAEPKMSPRVVQAFETTFADAEDAQWSVVENLFKVDFTLDERAMFAFYNANGDLVVSGKYLKTKQLPKATQKKLADVAKGYSIAEVFEINDGLESKYYATLTNGSERKVVESNGSKWSTFKTSSR